MTFVFTMKGLPGEADMVVPTLCNGPEHAKKRALELLAKHPARRAVEVMHRGRTIFQLGAPAPQTRPALEL